MSSILFDRKPGYISIYVTNAMLFILTACDGLVFTLVTDFNKCSLCFMLNDSYFADCSVCTCVCSCVASVILNKLEVRHGSKNFTVAIHAWVLCGTVVLLQDLGGGQRLITESVGTK